MEMNEYQQKALTTSNHPMIGQAYVYPTLGLVGEAGEVAEKIKKILRNDNGIITEEKKKEIAKEIGDVLWYTAVLAYELGLKLNDIAEMNIEKIMDRKARNVIRSEGDNR